MSRKIIAFLLLFVFVASSLNRPIVLLEYKLNQSTFAKNCENKNRPALRCMGKCVVMKKLAEEEKKDQQNPERRMELKNELIFLSSFSDLFSSLTFPQNTLYNIFSPAAKPLDIPSSIFHPPAFI